MRAVGSVCTLEQARRGQWLVCSTLGLLPASCSRGCTPAAPAWQRLRHAGQARMQAPSGAPPCSCSTVTSCTAPVLPLPAVPARGRLHHLWPGGLHPAAPCGSHERGQACQVSLRNSPPGPHSIVLVPLLRHAAFLHCCPACCANCVTRCACCARCAVQRGDGRGAGR